MVQDVSIIRGAPSNSNPRPVIVSGAVRGVHRIVGIVRQGMLEGVAEAMGLSYEAIQDTIAKDKGIMRRMIKVRFMQQSARSGLRSGQWRIDIKAESVEELIAKATAYSKWHIAQRIGTTVYKNPTTPGTKPIDMVEVMDNIRVNILPSVRRKIRAQGGDI